MARPTTPKTPAKVERTDPGQTLLRWKTAELREHCETRAAEKGISVNEWINRALTHAVANGGKVRITTTETAEF